MLNIHNCKNFNELMRDIYCKGLFFEHINEVLELAFYDVYSQISEGKEVGYVLNDWDYYRQNAENEIIVNQQVYFGKVSKKNFKESKMRIKQTLNHPYFRDSAFYGIRKFLIELFAYKMNVDFMEKVLKRLGVL